MIGERGLARRSAIILLLAAALLGVGPAMAQEPPPNQAGLVVVYGDGRVVTRCVSFTEEAISGADLLRRSGLSVVMTFYGGLGYGVCAIGGKGCGTGQECFCQCRGATCTYWVYSHRQPDGSWAVSGVGASSWLLHDGDVDGWVWGDGTVAPPVVSFEAVCGSEADVSSSISQAPSPTAEVRLTAPVSPTAAPAASLPIPATGDEPTVTLAPTPSPTITSGPISTPSIPPSFPSPVISSPSHPIPDLPDYLLFAFLLFLLAGGVFWAGLRRR
ncbi:MAG TPA: hypothetical protein ENI39_06935 [Anaerolineae bacterium]|nr:hypothetical protein [Anaerolineae bacterium]